MGQVKRHIEWDLGGNLKLPGAQDASPSQHIEVWLWTYEAHLSFRYPEFILRFHYIGMIDWITSHMTEFNFRPPFHLQRFRGQADIVWLKSSNLLITWVGLSNMAALILKLSRDLPWTTKTLLSLRRLQGYRGPLQGARDKDQPNSLLYNKTRQ